LVLGYGSDCGDGFIAANVGMKRDRGEGAIHTLDDARAGFSERMKNPSSNESTSPPHSQVLVERGACGKTRGMP